ncbi:hypothetical protein F5Y12DRAFT_788466 [Xylaria sp. FL1777]|nr:hypothetical protein F5Y12DRAFT_788466 [Xylaria sp. FL1777]
MEALERRMNNLQINARGLCCNHQPNSPCTKVASLACKSCLMVAYCSKPCQTAHWPTHRQDCNSPIMKGSWKPRWITENRPPTFMTHGNTLHVGFGTAKYLWGNVPAIDVIQLGQNEGVGYQNPINLLFAGHYKSPLNVVINDHEIDIVARNLIFLLIMLVEEDPGTAAEALLHVWYSALVTESCYDLLQKKLKPIVQDVCDKIAGGPDQTLLGKTWTFGDNSLRLVLTRETWMKLPAYFDVPAGMTGKRAHAVRDAVVNHPSRADYVDRALLMRSPASGLGMTKFRKDGILVPFGQPREVFTIPNPTIFDSSNDWPMMDSADPTSGWSHKAFLATKAGPAKQDVYGQLHHYLKRLFADFHQHLRSKPVSFELHHVDAKDLGERLAGRKFDRIDVSNICDMVYLGIGATLATFGPLLPDPLTNAHATLLTAFLNAVPEAKMMFRMMNPFAADIIAKLDTRAVLAYIRSDLRQPRGTIAQITQCIQTEAIKIGAAMDLVGDMDRYFDMYMLNYDFADVASATGLTMKTRHTIVAPWPLRVKSNGPHPSQKEKEDFKSLLGTSHVGHERYIEWKVDASVVNAAADMQVDKEACVLS